jgi:agmatine/peptidylarginine deiminase
MLAIWLRRHAGLLKWTAILLLGCGLFAAGAMWGSWRVQARLGDLESNLMPVDPCDPLPPPGEFSRQTAMILGCNELIRHHPKTFCEVVDAIRPALPLILLVGSDQERLESLELLRQADVATDNVCFIIMPLDTMWVRDYGPLFRRRANGSVFVVDMNYIPAGDAGEKRMQDDRASGLIAKVLGLESVKASLRLGGGNLLTNGEGLCVTTTSVIGNNPEYNGNVERIGDVLTETLGYKRWLFVRPLAGENTADADLMMTFVSPGAVVVGQLDPSTDPTNAAILDEAARALARVPTSRGLMRVYRIPMPPPYQGLWRSYTNVIQANGIMLVPSYSDVPAELQQRAIEIYRRTMPGWRIREINADTLVAKQGVLHCISKNVPGFVSLDRLAALTRGSSEPAGTPTQPGLFTHRDANSAGTTAPARKINE